MTFKEYINNQSKILSDLAKEDQKERNEYKEFVYRMTDGDYKKGAELWAKQKNRSKNDIFNDRERLNRFIGMKFNYSKFNEEDWKNFWLLAQHTDLNRDFQKKALAIIKQYIGTDNNYYKYLSDRISMAETGTQLFNTQSY